MINFSDFPSPAGHRQQWLVVLASTNSGPRRDRLLLMRFQEALRRSPARIGSTARRVVVRGVGTIAETGLRAAVSHQFSIALATPPKASRTRPCVREGGSGGRQASAKTSSVARMKIATSSGGSSSTGRLVQVPDLEEEVRPIDLGRPP